MRFDILRCMTLEDLLEAWRANNALNLELLSVVSDDDWDLKPGKGKTIRSNYVHLIGVRRMWCEEKVPKEAAAIPKLDWKTAAREEIVSGLEISNEAMLQLLRRREESVKKGNCSSLMFFAYAIAHEAHHRSQIEIALRINGKEPDEKFLYGLWEWGSKV